MCRVKKAAFTLISLTFLIAILCQAAYALELSTHASEYLDSYGASIYQGSVKGSVRIDFSVVGTERSDYVGVSELRIYESGGTRVATIEGTVDNGLLLENVIMNMGQYTYYGEPGVSYYARLTMYAERDGGSDSREYLTKTIMAPTRNS